jgi:hypothetical protein
MVRERDCFIIPKRDRGGDIVPDATQKEVGRRLYHVHREKRVEEAIKKIKHGVGTDWSQFGVEEIDLLGHLLQCTWNVIDQKTWDNIPFARMTAHQVQMILSHGEGVGPGKNPEPAAVAEIKKILLSLK